MSCQGDCAGCKCDPVESERNRFILKILSACERPRVSIDIDVDGNLGFVSEILTEHKERFSVTFDEIAELLNANGGESG